MRLSLSFSLIFISFSSILALSFSFFFLLIPPPPRSTLFPYTTLFRSQLKRRRQRLLFRPLSPHICVEAFEREGGLEQPVARSEEHTSELQSRFDLVCRLLLEKKKKNIKYIKHYYSQHLLHK